LGLRRFFLGGVAARRLHQTAKRGPSRPVLCLDQPAAGRRPAPRKITRAARRPVKTAGSGSKGPGQFRVGSTRGQPSGMVIQFRSSSSLAEPGWGPIQRAGSGTVAHGCLAGSVSPTLGCLQHPWGRSSQAAPVRRLAPQLGRQDSLTVRAWLSSWATDKKDALRGQGSSAGLLLGLGRLGLARRRCLAGLAVPETLLVEGLLFAQHVENTPCQPGRQDGQRLA
jgi:hypothetical protein